MVIKNIAVLTSPTSWLIPHVKKFTQNLNKQYRAKLFFDHNTIKNSYDILFILSYFKILPPKILDKNKHNLVVHESDLPKGKGWSPLFWQILENKNKIPIVLFEATKEIDAGEIYLKDYIKLKGTELYSDIRKSQAKKTFELCLKFLENPNIKSTKQKGSSSYYPKRTPKYSQLDINKSIKKQFNQLRIANNKDFPAFFYHNGQKYILKISKAKNISK